MSFAALGTKRSSSNKQSGDDGQRPRSTFSAASYIDEGAASAATTPQPRGGFTDSDTRAFVGNDAAAAEPNPGGMSGLGVGLHQRGARDSDATRGGMVNGGRGELQEMIPKTPSSAATGTQGR